MSEIRSAQSDGQYCGYVKTEWPFSDESYVSRLRKGTASVRGQQLQ